MGLGNASEDGGIGFRSVVPRTKGILAGAKGLDLPASQETLHSRPVNNSGVTTSVGLSHFPHFLCLVLAFL